MARSTVRGTARAAAGVNRGERVEQLEDVIRNGLDAIIQAEATRIDWNIRKIDEYTWQEDNEDIDGALAFIRAMREVNRHLQQILGDDYEW